MDSRKALVTVAVTVAPPPVTVMVVPTSAVTDKVAKLADCVAGGVETSGSDGAVLSWTTMRTTSADTLFAMSVAVTVSVLVWFCRNVTEMF